MRAAGLDAVRADPAHGHRARGRAIRRRHAHQVLLVWHGRRHNKVPRLARTSRRGGWSRVLQRHCSHVTWWSTWPIMWKSQHKRSHNEVTLVCAGRRGGWSRVLQRHCSHAVHYTISDLKVATMWSLLYKRRWRRRHEVSPAGMVLEPDRAMHVVICGVGARDGHVHIGEQELRRRACWSRALKPKNADWRLTERVGFFSCGEGGVRSTRCCGARHCSEQASWVCPPGMCFVSLHENCYYNVTVSDMRRIRKVNKSTTGERLFVVGEIFTRLLQGCTCDHYSYTLSNPVFLQNEVAQSTRDPFWVESLVQLDLKSIQKHCRTTGFASWD